MNVPTALRAPGTRKLTQLAIWVMFALSMVGGSALAAAPSGATSPSAAPGNSVPLAADTGPILLASGSGGSSGGGGSTARGRDVVNTYCTPGGPSASKACESERVLQLLPAYRWGGATELPSTLGPQDITAGPTTTIANVQFGLAGFIWQTVLTITHFALTNNAVEASGAAVATSMTSLAQGLGGAFLPTLVAVFVCAMGAIRVAKGKTPQGVQIILTGLLVLGAWQWMAANSAPNGESVPHLSPVGLAMSGSRQVDALAGTVASGFGLSGDLGSGGGIELVPGDKTRAGANCTDYMAALQDTFLAYSASNDAVTRLGSSGQLLVSNIWQRAYLKQWSKAAFDNANGNVYAARMVCHRLEDNAKVSPQIQFEMVGGPAGATKTSVATLGSYGTQGIGLAPFTAAAKDDDAQNGTMFAWAACPAKEGDPWYNAEGSIENTGQDNLAKECATWKKNDAAGMLRFDTPPKLATATAGLIGDAPSQAAGADVLTTVMAYWGHNSNRFIAGFTSLITAIAYGVLLGLPSLVAVAAGFGVLVLLCLLPATLLILALPSKDGGRHPTGVKLLKWTAQLLGIKLVYVGFLAVVLQVVSMEYKLVGGGSGMLAGGAGPLTLAAGAPGAGSVNAVWDLVIPIGTIFVLRFLMKKLGLGNPMSISGAAGMLTGGPKGKGAAGGLKGMLTRAPGGRALGRQLSKGKNAALGGVKHRASRAKDAAFLAGRVHSGKITPAQAAQIAGGSNTYARALAHNKAKRQNTQKGTTAGLFLRGGGTARPHGEQLDKELLMAVEAKKMTLRQARLIQGQIKKKRTAEGTLPGTVLPGGAKRGLDAAKTPDGAPARAGLALKTELRPAGSKLLMEQAAQDQAVRLSESTAGMTAEDHTAATWAFTAQDHAALQRGGALDGVATEVSEAEQQAAVTAAIAGFPGLSLDSVIATPQGYPLLLRPLPFNADGTVMIPDDMDDDTAALYLRSRFQYMPDNVQRADETKDTFATRVMLTGKAIGAVGDDGVLADAFIEYDNATLAARGRDPRYASDFARVQVSPLIETAVNDFMTGGGHQMRLTTPIRVRSTLVRDAETSRVAIEHAWEGVLDVAGKARGAKGSDNRAFRDAVARVEEDVPAVLEELLGGVFKQTAAKWRVEGMTEPQIAAQLDLAFEPEMGQINVLVKELHRRGGEVIAAGPARRHVELKTLIDRATEMRDHLAGDLEHAAQAYRDAEHDAAMSENLRHTKSRPANPEPPGAQVPKFPFDAWIASPGGLWVRRP